MGCATPSQHRSEKIVLTTHGAVSSEVVDKAKDERYQIHPGEQFFQEMPSQDNIQPSYPENLLSKQLQPVSVIARLVVRASGEVERAEIIESSAPDAEFSEAVLVAVRTWTFVPLTRVVGNKSEPLPFTQDYRFTFKQENGRAIVVQDNVDDS